MMEEKERLYRELSIKNGKLNEAQDILEWRRNEFIEADKKLRACFATEAEYEDFVLNHTKRWASEVKK